LCRIEVEIPLLLVLDAGGAAKREMGRKRNSGFWRIVGIEREGGGRGEEEEDPDPKPSAQDTILAP
jgi:hypothetical protein